MHATKATINMNTTNYYKSLSAELESLKNRVRNFIHDSHWQTDGEWKESVLRSILLRNMPDTVKIGRGFIVTKNGKPPPMAVDSTRLCRSGVEMWRKIWSSILLGPANAVGKLKGKSAIRIHREYLGRDRNFTGFHFWARGYFVSTVGLDEQRVRDYIVDQEKREQKEEQLTLSLSEGPRN